MEKGNLHCGSLIGLSDGFRLIKRYFVEVPDAAGLQSAVCWDALSVRGAGKNVQGACNGVNMGISVIFANGDERNVPSYMLDYLIREKKIVAFLRSTGWVQVGLDPIRKSQQPMTRAGERWSDFLYKRKQA